ncbi:DUF2778 domain-containing protein [Burkholderia guangdongensis]|uniref:DUF2778 domain-containing protein n=1 Tax=Burkholderia guangdongensis TaxID=1792500 RepID=UPI0015CB891E|nr:DUF2778 domain-containing protein [Burkholderia guangdongensis]
MPVTRCSFVLNGLPMGTLRCGNMAFPAFSGRGQYTGDPKATDRKNDGPLPKGRYYIVSRESGGHLGWLYDAVKDRFSNANRSTWFALYRNDGVIDDWTFINGVKRGNFRLHPAGRQRLSEGCITLSNQSDFDRLRTYLLANPAGTIPGTTMRYFGILEVR